MESRIFDELREIVGPRGLITSREELHTYECDGLTNFRVLPRAVLLPDSTEQVQKIVRVCHREKLPFVARGSGTGLSGGALPVENGIVISLTRMNKILEVDLANARVAVEPGVINLDVTGRVAPQEYFYAPDPSSQSVCSIGGNVAENSGGAHCLKYGFTTTHVLGLEVVLADGSLVHLGGKTLDAPGYDLMGVFVGSEGTLGIATKIILRIVKRPECVRTLLAAFPSTNEAGAAVSDMIGAGMLPAAIEMMDNLAIQAAEAAVHANYPNCGALLLVELDGPAAEVAALMGHVDEICRKNGAWEIRVAQSDDPAHRAAKRDAGNRAAEQGSGIARGECVSRRGREFASAGFVRPQNSRAGRNGGSAFEPDFGLVYRGGRIDHRRARSRRRQKENDAENVQRAGFGDDAAGALRVRSFATFESEQDISASAAVRGKAGRVCSASSGNGGNRGAILNGRQRFCQGDCQYI